MPTSINTRKAFENYTKGGREHETAKTRLIELDLYIDPIKISHDDCIRWLNQELELSNTAQLVKNFIYGIETSKPEYRAGLSAYSVTKNLPPHGYYGTDVYCEICGAFKAQEIDLTLLNCYRYLYGSLTTMTPAELALFLQLNTRLPLAPPTNSKKLISILKEITYSSPEETPSTLIKRLSKDKEIGIPKIQLRGLLETFGYLGILQTPDDQGYLYKYTPPFSRPSKSSKSDWRYPVDLWTGAQSINIEALNYWFSDHPEIIIAITTKYSAPV